MRIAWLVLALLVGCSSARQPTTSEATPGLVFPLHFAEGHGDGAVGTPLPAGSAGAAGTSAGTVAAAPATSALPAPTRPQAADPPDPTPLRQADQWEYTFRYERGSVALVAVRAVHFDQPVVSARRMGRYALELWIGRELVDRVRFDFPLLAAEEPPSPGSHPLRAPPRLTAGPAYAKVLVPAAERARSARLVDRATRDEVELIWPPQPMALGLRDAPARAVSSASAEPASTPAPSASPPSSFAPAAAAPAR